jgi:signal-transduction protein with cAMP-binding, CBS, and nucleotidyltransferase domain
MTTLNNSTDARTPVGSLVNGPAVTVEKSATLQSVAQTLGDLGIGMVIVMDKGSIAGVVSERDLIWAIARGAQLDEVWAADIMTDGAVTVEPSLPVVEAAAMMASENARHLLVLHGDDPGVVSMRDVIEYLID